MFPRSPEPPSTNPSPFQPDLAPTPLATVPHNAAARTTGVTAKSVVGAAVLAAVLASGGTFAAIGLARPAPSPAATTASPNATTTSTAANGQTTVTATDITGVVAAARESVVTITSQLSNGRGQIGTGIGSGIILTSDGYILTNRHVVEGSQSLTVTLSDGLEVPASLVTVSDEQDLALVKAESRSLKAATIGNSAAIKVGQTAIAIGSPLGTYTETVTEGIISALNRDVTVTDELTRRPVTLHGLLQTDAAINQGNSGGPLLDAGGAVVGVNTAASSAAEGIGFAIPIAKAERLIAQARSASVG
jgi:S1-C subfamily serine protease